MAHSFRLLPYGPIYDASFVIVDDFDADGSAGFSGNKLHISSVPQVAILLGDGNGDFKPPRYFETGYGALFLTSADFNKDGNPDLAVANSNSTNVSILIGLGDGNFQAPTMFEVGSRPWSISAADFNSDNNLDLAVANYESGGVSILLGTGDGGFWLAAILFGKSTFSL